MRTATSAPPDTPHINPEDFNTSFHALPKESQGWGQPRGVDQKGKPRNTAGEVAKWCGGFKTFL